VRCWAFSTLGIENTLHFAENDVEAWDMLDKRHKISPIPT
jgi:hypothetical protein